MALYPAAANARHIRSRLGTCQANAGFAPVPAKQGYFGRIVGSPPGLPGGGMMGVLPTFGVGARISGSTPVGGHSTPSDRASLSPRGSERWPVVVPCGVILLPCGVDSVGAQLLARAGGGGAVWAGGVAGVGGACANAAPEAAIIMSDRKREFLVMSGNGRRGRRFRTRQRNICSRHTSRQFETFGQACGIKRLRATRASAQLDRHDDSS
jgi:hypothetical protein